jgi:hypothetical protein
MSRKSPWLAIATVVAVLTVVSGCARINEGVAPPSAQESPVFSNYWANRGYDAMDLFRLQWGSPRDFKAFGATAKATCLAQAGFVFFEGKKVGMERRAVGILRQKKLEGGISPVYFTTIREGGEFGNYFMQTTTEWAKARDRRIIRNGFFWSDGTGRPISFGAELELFCFGGPDVQFYLCELADFLVGWFGLDPRGDDVSRLVHAGLDNQFFEKKAEEGVTAPPTEKAEKK